MIGKKILELRKVNHLSQEELAEKIAVTRQTISNWELGETIPDLKQATLLAKEFNISVDELTNSEKLSNKIDKTINNSNKILKIVKTILIILTIAIILTLLIGIFVFESMDYFKATPSGSGVGTMCYYKDEYITYTIMKDYQSGDLSLNTTDSEIIQKFKPYNYTNAEKMLNEITDYIESNGGECNITNNN